MAAFDPPSLNTVISPAPTASSVWVWSGDVDAADQAVHIGALQALLDDHPPTLTIDLAAVTFLDCAGLSVLVRANNAPATQLLLQAVPVCVQRLLQATGLDETFALTAPLDSPVAG